MESPEYQDAMHALDCIQFAGKDEHLQTLRRCLQSMSKDAARYRYLKTEAGTEGKPNPAVDGSVWVVRLRQPKGVIPEMLSAGYGADLDAVVDAAYRRDTQP